MSLRNNISVAFWKVGFWLAWSIATLLMVLPASKLPPVHLWDKAEHALTFFGLLVLAQRAYRRRFSRHTLASYLLTYGVAIECIQHFIPSRSFSGLDIVADACGLLIAYCVLLCWKRL